ncbi:MAG: hypothetical protein GKR89_35055 [Candidatus Latescibacteria bacterium]|nr:hypothetical protein [Candidatus Latescibacterota bacterium]
MRMLFAGLLVAVLAFSAQGESGNMGQIAFVSDRDGDAEIYLMNGDGSDPKRLTDQPGLDGHPTWSPDGKQLAFVSNRDGNFELYSMDMDSGAVTRLTDSPAPDIMPTWGPDGEIVFVSGRDGAPQLYAIDPASRQVRRLTRSQTEDWTPSWSPDGGRIAYAAGGDLHLIGADGTGMQALIEGEGINGVPSWSPDGARIVFQAQPEPAAKISLLRILDVSSGAVRPLGKGFRADWSPDGRRLAVERMEEEGDNREIYIVAADGSGLRNLSNNDAKDEYPAWRP